MQLLISHHWPEDDSYNCQHLSWRPDAQNILEESNKEPHSSFPAERLIMSVRVSVEWCMCMLFMILCILHLQLTQLTQDLYTWGILCGSGMAWNKILTVKDVIVDDFLVNRGSLYICNLRCMLLPSCIDKCSSNSHSSAPSEGDLSHL